MCIGCGHVHEMRKLRCFGLSENIVPPKPMVQHIIFPTELDMLGAYSMFKHPHVMYIYIYTMYIHSVYMYYRYRHIDIPVEL